ncbi:Hypothetical predicted protein [Octopus vulgaris]|uniref:Uncharacterized protein n=1 Tax=Octopus vulgaris TaxID=6645 RepID=A0AA36AU72_OCTVU|nr:Hypothetical predicted protein [Octopus vulgaris]
MHRIVIDKVHNSHTPIKDDPKPSQSFLNIAYGVIQVRNGTAALENIRRVWIFEEHNSVLKTIFFILVVKDIDESYM